MSDRARQKVYLDLISGRQGGPAAGLERALLSLAALPYRAAMAARRAYWRFAARRVGLPVVSVGNLTVGGTGKTPLVAFLARRLVAMGHRPVVVSRGYKSRPGRVGDETASLRDELPPVVIQIESPDRYTALQRVIGTEPHDVAILDDGFQHIRLRRDLDIVAIDATQPFGFGHCLPRGLLREPVSALRRAHVVAITRSDQVEAGALSRIEARVRRHLPKEGLVLHALHRPTGLLLLNGDSEATESLKGQRCFAFCGLANPGAFYRTLADLGADLAATRDFADHHAYSREDIAEIVRAAAGADAQWTVTTTKDFAKVASDELAPAWPAEVSVAALRVEIALTEGDDARDGLLKDLVGVGESQPVKRRGREGIRRTEP